jgi:hypothetical protein
MKQVPLLWTHKDRRHLKKLLASAARNLILNNKETQHFKLLNPITVQVLKIIQELALSYSLSPSSVYVTSKHLFPLISPEIAIKIECGYFLSCFTL